ncbi:MAG: hypothetical protein GY751_07955 [Bacteroidetes bacterium]|nr:hypothetical protein [Bacteroidota bacterium]
MVKSLVIAVFAGSLSMASLDCIAHTGDLKDNRQTVHWNNQATETDHSNDLLASLNGNSPSSRKHSHWLVAYEENEMMPMAPDELVELNAEPEIYSGTIHKIKRIEREKGIETAEVTEVTKVWYEQVRKDADIEIYVSGGGFRGGINPRINDQIMISNSGLVQRLYETELDGRRETKTQIDREELFELVKWIAENGFFEFNNEYDCPERDQVCWQRKEKRPSPLPLKIVVAMGPHRNVVSVPIFSPEKTQDYIPYPDNLRKIVKAIYDFASL